MKESDLTEEQLEYYHSLKENDPRVQLALKWADDLPMFASGLCILGAHKTEVARIIGEPWNDLESLRAIVLSTRNSA